ncbi:MAG: diguanylate cyclase [Candidatus Hydrogenedentales bacterium]|jgi:diguanylate cyclase (GGDEF)-like protein
MSESDKKRGDTTKLILPEELAQLRAMQSKHKRVSLIVLSGWQIGREFVIDTPELTIGRSVDAEVSINLPSVSRQHARISFAAAEEESYFYLADLKSMNGTSVNNEEIKEARLQSGDKIQIGDVVVKFLIQDPMDAKFHEEVHRRIHYNQLTGLLTLESFKPQLAEEIAKAKPGTRFTVAMTDLDGLKKVNDTYGHPMGSLVIQEMGRTIRELLRTRDRSGLYGGDEAIFLYPDTLLDEAVEIAERLREGIASMPLSFEDKPFGVTISQGLAEWPTHGQTMEQIIAAADGALYAAKGAGRNCVRVAGE